MPEADTNFAFRCVAFFDILGFSRLVEADALSSQPTHLQRILRALESVQDLALPSEDLRMQAFSDSIVVSGPFTPPGIRDALQASISLQGALVAEAVPIRGAISFGRHFDNGRIIYSAGLVVLG